MMLSDFQDDFDNLLCVNGKYEPRKWKSHRNLRRAIAECRSNDFDTIEEKIWALKTRTYVRPVCECGAKVNFKDTVAGFFPFCGLKCSANSKTTKQKTAKTLRKRFGGHHTQNKKWSKSFVRECRKNGSYEKMKNTMNQKYGGNPFTWESSKLKIKQTLLKKFGVDNPSKSPIIRDKAAKTHFQRYGVSYPMQNPASFEKCQKAAVQARFKFKTLKLESGKILKNLQGYEPYVIGYFILMGIDEEDLITERKIIPKIDYFWEGKERVYFPDFLIKSKNLLVEVKSAYTWKIDMKRTLEKQKAAKRAGFDHQIIIWDQTRKEISEII